MFMFPRPLSLGAENKAMIRVCQLSQSLAKSKQGRRARKRLREDYFRPFTKQDRKQYERCCVRAVRTQLRPLNPLSLPPFRERGKGIGDDPQTKTSGENGTAVPQQKKTGICKKKVPTHHCVQLKFATQKHAVGMKAIYITCPEM